MKKTLVALAALAATGAFAQVKITGEFAYGYQAATTGGAAGVDAGGWGVDTSEVDFQADEDLGGGYKVTVKMGMAGLDRSGESAQQGVDANHPNGAVTGRNASIDLTTPFGLLNMGSKRNADYLGQGVAGVANIWYGFDGSINASRSRRDQWTFAVPVTSALTLAFGQQEASSNVSSTANPQGLGAGGAGDGVVTGQRLSVVAANYKGGNFVVDGQYLVFDSKNVAAAVTAADTQYRLSGNYDFGAAKLGAGTTVTNYAVAGKSTDVLVNVNVPMGALTLGVAWAQNKLDDAGAASGTKSGYALQGTYNLSKQTYVIAAYKRYDAAVGAAVASTQSNLLLVKDF